MTQGIQLSLFKLFSWSSQLRALSCIKDTKAMHALSLPRVSGFVSSFCWLSKVKEEKYVSGVYCLHFYIWVCTVYSESLKSPSDQQSVFLFTFPKIPVQGFSRENSFRWHLFVIKKSHMKASYVKQKKGRAYRRWVLPFISTLFCCTFEDVPKH